MRTWIMAVFAALACCLSGATAPALADGWTDSLTGRPFAATKSAPSKANRSNLGVYQDPDSRPQRKASKPSRASTPAPVASFGGGTTGIASYYWQPQPVASGGRFDPNAMTAAHKTLPFGTRVRVTHLGNGRSVDVTINDRGPYIAGRIIDLSKGAAGVINMQGQGIAQVRMDVLGR